MSKGNIRFHLKNILIFNLLQKDLLDRQLIYETNKENKVEAQSRNRLCDKLLSLKRNNLEKK